jgi:ABC-type transport system involved in Fe-S cluster assembly fused permease/ATPase subunit
LFEYLKEFTDSKTTIFTSHRLSNVFLADRVVVLEYGKVLEIGSQEDLFKSDGRYAELVGYQKSRINNE